MDVATIAGAGKVVSSDVCCYMCFVDTVHGSISSIDRIPNKRKGVQSCLQYKEPHIGWELCCKNCCVP